MQMQHFPVLPPGWNVSKSENAVVYGVGPRGHRKERVRFLTGPDGYRKCIPANLVDAAPRVFTTIEGFFPIGDPIVVSLAARFAECGLATE